MAELPVIEGVLRITINWNRVVGVQPRNVFHVHIDGGGEGDIGSFLDTSYHTAVTGGHNPHAALGSDYVANTIDILPLDGTTGTLTATLEHPWGGSASGEILPSSAAIVRFNTGTRGPKARGRQYIGPTTEGVCVNGILHDDTATEMQLGWTAFNDALGTGDAPMHIVVASYKHAEAFDVVGFSAERPLGTQRRRQDQLR